MAYLWPLILIVVSNSIYHICAKSLPAKADPFAALTVTYLIGAVFSAALYFLLNRGSADLAQEWRSLNWTPYVLGFIVVAMEAGNVYAYRAGWSVNTLRSCRRPASPCCCLRWAFCSTARALPQASSSGWRSALQGCFFSTNELCRGFCRGMMEKTGLKREF